MSYDTQFTDVSLVEALTGETIDDESEPTAEQVLQWIEEVEMDMVGKGYSTQELTSVTMDISPSDPSNELSLLQQGLIYSSRYTTSGKAIALPHTPIISVTNVQRNIAGYSDAASWDNLTEGPGDDTDFLLVKQTFKGGLKGVALYFYRNAPFQGYQRLKLDYTWGHELPAEVLREFATCQVSLKFLYSKYLRKEPVFDVDVAGMRTKLNPFTNVHEFIIDRLDEIKEEWLPSDWVGAVLIP